MRDLEAARRLFALLLVAVALTACGKKPEAPAVRTALTVTATTVALAPLPRQVDASGTVAAWQEVPVASEVGGLEVMAVLVDEGSHVRQGQTLIQLDDRVLRAQMNQQAAAVVAAQAIVAQNEAALHRSRELSAKGFLAASALDTAVANEKTAAAQVLTAQASLAETRAKLDQAIIRAPVAGLITGRSVVKGQVVSVGTQLLTLVREDQLELNANIPESDLPYVREGMAVTVTNEQGVKSTGRVRLVTPQVNPQTRLGFARITLPGGAGFKSGNFARASIDVGAAPAIAISQDAIVFRDGKPGVYILDGGNKVHFSAIDTGERTNGMVEIRSGLQPGQRIVTSGGGFLGEGDRVAIGAGGPAGAH